MQKLSLTTTTTTSARRRLKGIGWCHSNPNLFYVIYFPSSHLKEKKNKNSSRSCIDAQNVITKMYRVMESEGMFTKLSHNHRVDVKHSPAASVSPSRDTYFSWCRADLRMNHRKKLIKTVQPDHFILLPSGLSIKIAKSYDFFYEKMHVLLRRWTKQKKNQDKIRTHWCFWIFKFFWSIDESKGEKNIIKGKKERNKEYEWLWWRQRRLLDSFTHDFSFAKIQRFFSFSFYFFLK